MGDNSSSQRKAQLDKAEREHLEDVVTEMRERVEVNVRFQIYQKGIDDEPGDQAALDEDTAALVEAIDLEATDGRTWEDAVDEYVTGVGYTIVNRLVALRCMEVRDFIDESVTVFKENGLTPAGESLFREEFLIEEEAIVEAYHRACDALSDEIQILFDRSSAYSLIDPDKETFEDLCGLLNEVSEAIWRADDVLGRIYEYYRCRPLDSNNRSTYSYGVPPLDVPRVSQFYTPHWIVRMLTDNSLGKLYLENQGQLQDAISRQSTLTADERKQRSVSLADTPDVADFCTYLVSSEQTGDSPTFDEPADISVIDPVCGSGHFLMYAFDVLERIWRTESDIDYAEIPQAILRHNLYGVDMDRRACQLATLNLYLKGRSRAEEEGVAEFKMPNIGIVCADTSVPNVDDIGVAVDEVAGDRSEVASALRQVLERFENIQGLGSLLDVDGELGGLIKNGGEQDGFQIQLEATSREYQTLERMLSDLREAIGRRQDDDSFLAQDLRNFVRLLCVLTKENHVALMHPPIAQIFKGSHEFSGYIEQQYRYPRPLYLNFFEVCNRLTKAEGLIGMVAPRGFMYNRNREVFRSDLIGGQGRIELLAELGLGALPNVTTRMAGIVVHSGGDQNATGTFLRLHDTDHERKEDCFVNILANRSESTVRRRYDIELSEFDKIPRTTLCYSIPKAVRDLHQFDNKIHAESAGIQGKSVCRTASGLQVGNNKRFVRFFWEVQDYATYRPFATDGSDAWLSPEVSRVVEWSGDGTTLKRLNHSLIRNEDLFGQSGLRWTRIGRGGRRFGYYPGGLFDNSGSMLVACGGQSPWKIMALLNSNLYHNLFLSLTLERDWDLHDIGSVPWPEQLDEVDELDYLVIKQYVTMLQQRFREPTSPYYVAPALHPNNQLEFFYNHPHQSRLAESELDIEFDSVSPTTSIRDASRASRQAELRDRQTLEDHSEQIDSIIYSQLGIEYETQKAIEQEISLRTSVDLEDRAVPDPDSVPEGPENIDKQVKELVHHFAIEAVRQAKDGIVPLDGTKQQASMLDRIIARFEDAYGKYAEDRLVEADDILGARSAAEETYPNLRAFVENNLFDYHVDRMDNTPILWKLTTERFADDGICKGFAWFVDYHSVDSGLLDRLANQHLDPRKVELRKRRSAANRRRTDESLSTSELAEAAEEYERCANGLKQISVFEDALQELGSTDERNFEDKDRELVKDLAPKVATFREETRHRVDTLAELREFKDESWFQDTFSNTCWNKVDKWREEWLDALDELRSACEEYAKPVDEPVEAHLADLFDYYHRRLKGSDHFPSTGILFMTYYFEREGTDLLNDDGHPSESLTEDKRLLASLATGLDDSSVVDEMFLETIADDEAVEEVENLPPLAEFKALAEEIDDRCQTIHRRIPSDWTDRAISEITTAGYQPNHKHGVEINITPLAEKKIVPETVDEQVI